MARKRMARIARGMVAHAVTRGMAEIRERRGELVAVGALCIALTVSGLTLIQVADPATLASLAARAGRTTPTATSTGFARDSHTSLVVAGGGCIVTSAAQEAERYLLTLLNEHRAQAGAPPVTLNPALSAGARQHACDMARHHMLSHLSSDGTTPLARIQATGLTFHTWGENIGTGSGQGLLAEIKANDAGMIAEPIVCCDHAWNILNRAHTQVGIGIIAIGDAEWMTEDFIG